VKRRLVFFCAVHTPATLENIQEIKSECRLIKENDGRACCILQKKQGYWLTVGSSGVTVCRFLEVLYENAT